MTPEEARELRDLSAPGPWIIGRHKYADAHRIYDKSGNLIVWGARGFNADLMAAARDLAATVAGLRYEYAVQNLVGDEWLYEDIAGRNLSPGSTEHIVWWSDPIPQSDIEDRGEGMARIVRRLVSEPEVVE